MDTRVRGAWPARGGAQGASLAAGALVPRLVEEDNLQAANSLGAVNGNVVGVVGPSLGAALLGFLGLPSLVLVDSASYRIPLIRICVEVPEGRTYLAHEAQLQRAFDTLIPLLDRYGVTLGIQNHYGRYIANAMGIRRLIERYDPRHIGAVLDVAHCALGGRQGLCSWATVATELQSRDYHGPICLTAEYGDEAAVDRLGAGSRPGLADRVGPAQLARRGPHAGA